MLKDDIQRAKEYIANSIKHVDGYGDMISIPMSIYRQAISEIEQWQSGETTEFILRQELRVQQAMYTSKERELSTALQQSKHHATIIKELQATINELKQTINEFEDGLARPF